MASSVPKFSGTSSSVSIVIWNVCSSQTMRSIMAKLSSTRSAMRFWVGSNFSCAFGFSMVRMYSKICCCVVMPFSSSGSDEDLKVEPPRGDEEAAPSLLAQAEHCCRLAAGAVRRRLIARHFHGIEGQQPVVLFKALHVRQVLAVQQQEPRRVAEHGGFAHHASRNEPDRAGPGHTHDPRARQQPTALTHPDVEDLVCP